MVAFILPSNSTAGYDIEGSVRLNPSNFLTMDGAMAAGDRRKFTFSVWVKRVKFGINTVVYSAEASDVVLRFGTSDDLQFKDVNNDSFNLSTNNVFRDNAAWYHIVVAFDSAQSTAANRLKMYVNGTQQQNLGTNSPPDQNHDSEMNNDGDSFYIGARTDSTSEDESMTQHFNGYISEFHHIDGLALGPTAFAKTNLDGEWVPIKYGGAFGTNGMYLEFQQTGTDANAAGIGADTSGKANHFNVNGGLAATEIGTDTPTNNFATLNIHTGNTQLTANGYTEGGLKVNSNVTGVSAGNYLMSYSTIGLTSGKWYAEFKVTGNLYSSGTDSSSLIGVGSGVYKYDNGNQNTAVGGFTHWWLDHDDDRVLVDGSTGNNNMNSGSHVAANDIIGVYLNCDLTMPKVTFHRNGAALGGASASPYNVRRTGINNIGTNNPIFFLPVVRYGDGSNNGRFECNFGNPIVALSSALSDANGFGSFEYSPTLGGVHHYAVCTKNLAKYG